MVKARRMEALGVRQAKGYRGLDNSSAFELASLHKKLVHHKQVSSRNDATRSGSCALIIVAMLRPFGSG